MIKALNLNSPYKVFLNSDNHTYHFVTQNGIKYITYFTDADEYFDNFELKSNIYVFVFDRSRVNENSNVYDESIKVTIIAIIKNFFKNKQNVLIFVADINEDKHRARHRLFNNWKNEFDNLSEFEKYGSMLFCMGNNKSGSKPCNHGYFIFKLFHPFGVYDF